MVYNQIHVMLGLTGPQQWEQWIESINKVEQLAPKVVVAGHKRPEASDQDVSRMIDETRSYIGAFAEAAKKANDADDLVQVMSDKYPHFGKLVDPPVFGQILFAKRSSLTVDSAPAIAMSALGSKCEILSKRMEFPLCPCERTSSSRAPCRKVPILLQKSVERGHEA